MLTKGGIPNVFLSSFDLLEDLSYLFAINQFKQYNPGFILQEGDLMVYDAAKDLISFYRGNELLYQRDSINHITFGSNYDKYIPNLKKDGKRKRMR